MNIEDFKDSLQTDGPPYGIDILLKALWLDAKGDWNASHSIVQDLNTRDAAWIHAYLHRKEGDLWNADYWYNRAGKRRPQISLQEEWNDLVVHFSE